MRTVAASFPLYYPAAPMVIAPVAQGRNSAGLRQLSDEETQEVAGAGIIGAVIGTAVGGAIGGVVGYGAKKLFKTESNSFVAIGPAGGAAMGFILAAPI